MTLTRKREPRMKSPPVAAASARWLIATIVAEAIAAVLVWTYLIVRLL